jgi:hypothetical protein
LVMGANNRLRDAVYQAALGSMRSYSDMADEDDEAVSRAITAAVMTGLEHVELEGPRPYAEFSDPYEPPMGGGVKVWESKPNAHGDRVEVGAVQGDVSITAVEPDGEHRTAHAHPRDIPALCRAMYQAAGLPWPGDEVERLRERVRELESATCMPEVMAVVEAWRSYEHYVMRGFQMEMEKPVRALVEAVRSGKRCGLHPATEVLKRARAVVDQRPHCGTFMREYPLLSEAIKYLEVELRNLPREGGE